MQRAAATGSFGGADSYSKKPGSNWAKKQELEQELVGRSEGGDAYASFSLGYIKSTAGGEDNWRQSLALFKRAGDGGIADGYNNVANQYSKGEGAIQSRLAAAEWYYRAGVAYLKTGKRERAFAALEAVRASDRDSTLAKKLEIALRASAPR
jgi:TPR repeat protein